VTTHRRHVSVHSFSWCGGALLRWLRQFGPYGRHGHTSIRYYGWALPLSAAAMASFCLSRTGGQTARVTGCSFTYWMVTPVNCSSASRLKMGCKCGTNGVQVHVRILGFRQVVPSGIGKPVHSVIRYPLSCCRRLLAGRRTSLARDPPAFHKRGVRTSLRIEGNVEIHPTAVVWTHDQPSSLVTRGSGRIVVGKESFINCGAWIRAEQLVEIGEHCLVGPRVMIMDNDAHQTGGEHKGGGASAPVMIKDSAWIGAGAILLKGVTIGERAVVGAGSVVTRDVPCDTTVVGNPARPARRPKK
jgi:acetyltransferase-like isoleucine patch superfamily enzyme